MSHVTDLVCNPSHWILPWALIFSFYAQNDVTGFAVSQRDLPGKADRALTTMLGTFSRAQIWVRSFTPWGWDPPALLPQFWYFGQTFWHPDDVLSIPLSLRTFWRIPLGGEKNRLAFRWITLAESTRKLSLARCSDNWKMDLGRQAAMWNVLGPPALEMFNI